MTRHFGKIVTLPILLVVAAVHYAGINISYNAYYTNARIQQGYSYTAARSDAFMTHVLALCFVTGMFCLLTYTLYQRFSKVMLGAFVAFMLVFQFFLVSTLTDFHERANQYAYDADQGIAGMVLLPMVIIICWLMGWLFDGIKNT